jgi:hypothetical protein
MDREQLFELKRVGSPLKIFTCEQVFYVQHELAE